MPYARQIEKPSELRCMSEHADDIVRELEEQKSNPLVRVEEALPDGRIAVVLTDRNHGGFTYDFYCSSLEDALQWITHLAPKTWVTKRHLEVFAYLMRRHFAGRAPMVEESSHILQVQVRK